MPDKPDEEPTQRTERGQEIPVPSRDEFLRNLQKVAKPKDDDDDRSS